MKAKVVKVVGWIALMVVVNYVLDAIHQPTLQPRLRPILFGVVTGVNREALASIKCRDSQCDTAALSLNWGPEPDYVIDLRNRYFIWAPSSSNEDPQHYSPLDFADTSFIRGFREPASYRTPDGEVWRLLSREARSKGKNVEVLVGFAEQSPTNML